MQQHILGALEVNGKTIAVLGCGPDVIYPERNAQIYKEIIKTGGAIVSEYPEGTKISSENFRQRNRIVSGLSLGVLVVEAEWRSGTTITAGFAKEQGKDVFCLPNSIQNSKGVGTNILIRKGAKLVLKPSEILENYGKHKIEQITIDDLKQASKRNYEEKENENIDKKKYLKLEDVKEEYREVYKILYEPLSANDISEKAKIEITEIYSKLFMMELEGLIKQEGNKYIITKPC